MGNCCNDCRFWVSNNQNAEIGKCVRFPPFPVMMAVSESNVIQHTKTMWPVCRTNDWCGEYKRK